MIMNRQDQAKTIIELLDQAVEEAPHKAFIRTIEQELTYLHFASRVRTLAGGLASMGVGPGQSVALMMNNSCDQICCWFAIAYLGAIHVPINNQLRAERLKHVLSVAEVETVIIDDEFFPEIGAVWPKLAGLRRLIIRNSIKQEHGTPWPENTLRLENLDQAEPLKTHCPRQPMEDATMLFTSGTTGPSKACVLSHHYLVRQGQIHARQFGFTASDVLYSPFPLFHIDAATLTVVAALASQATAAIGRRFSASGFWAEARKFRATVFNFMGATLTILWKSPPSVEDRSHDVRMAWGVPMPEWKAGFERRFGIPLYQVYGSTDAGVSVYDPIDGDQRPGTCGKVIDEYEIKIVNRKGQTEIAGQPGEILVRGKEPGIVMSRYHAMPEATAKTIDEDGWVHTGDLGSMDEEGYLSFHGRLTDSIRRRGENISAFEVEEVLVSHPDIVEAAAVGVPSELTEEDVKVCVVLRSNAEMTPESIYEYCASQAPGFMVPRYIELMNSLPKTPTQKVEKFRLKTLGPTVWDSQACLPREKNL